MTKPRGQNNMNMLKTAPARQQGAALVIGLIILMVLTLIGVTAMQSTSMQERMAFHMRNQNLAFQGAEAALRAGEIDLEDAVLPDFDGTDGYHQPAAAGTTPLWELDSFWSDAGNLITYGTTFSTLNSAPRYFIEELPAVTGAATGGSLEAGKPLDDFGMYRVTARAEGGTDSAVVILQSTYRR